MKKVVGILDATMKGGLVLTTTVMIVTCTLQVLSRYVLDHPFSWTEEVARFSFIWWSFLGAAYVVRLNGHLGMDILVKVLPRKWRTVAQKLVFFYKVSNIYIFCEYFIGQLQISFKVIRAF